MAVNRRAGQKSDSVAIRDRSEGAATRSQWLRTREALDTEELLRVEGAVGLAELGVALVGNLAAPDVEHALPF